MRSETAPEAAAQGLASLWEGPSRPLDDHRAADLIAQLTHLLGEPPFRWLPSGGLITVCAIWDAWRDTDATRDELSRLFMWAGSRDLLRLADGRHA